MEKTFCVSVDFTVAKNIYVQAEDEKHAISIARSQIDENPYGYARGFSHYVDYEIVEAHEEED